MPKTGPPSMANDFQNSSARPDIEIRLCAGTGRSDFARAIMTWDGPYTSEMVQGLNNGTWRRDSSGEPRKVGELTGDGLRRIVKTDPWTERKYYEYEQIDPNARKRWMDDFRAPVYLQTVGGKDIAWNRKIHAERMAQFEAEGRLTEAGELKW
jgi:hypothetical protein